MNEEINIYCDESCYLQHDDSQFMSIGGIWCPKDKIIEINADIKKIKEKYNLPPTKEIKWTKISNANKQLYIDIINYFFDNHDLSFRCVVVDKTKLNHSKFHQTHDDFYYKIYFELLKQKFYRNKSYNVYVDIKDTHSYQKCLKLHEICCNANYDFSHEMIKKIQPIRSEESQIIQIADVLMGAVIFANRYNEYKNRSETKKEIVRLIKEKTSYSLTRSTYLSENKFNLFFWEGTNAN